jgi:hypothetical protein
MALNGTNELVKKLDEFKNMYSDYRLELFKEAFPQFQISPRNVEPGLRSALVYFLKRVDDLSQEIELYDEEQTPRTMEAMKAVQPILTAWEARNIKAASSDEVFEEDIELGIQFKLEMPKHRK